MCFKNTEVVRFLKQASNNFHILDDAVDGRIGAPVASER